MAGDTTYSFHRGELLDAIDFCQTTHDTLNSDNTDCSNQVSASTANWVGQDKTEADNHRQQFHSSAQNIIDCLQGAHDALVRILDNYDTQEMQTARTFAT